MHKTTFLTLAALLMVAGTLILCRATPRFHGETHLLPVGRFPQQIEAWYAGPDIATDSAIQARIPTARLVQRNYTGPGGSQINLLLLTATDDEDFHQPTACLPGQGWTLQDQKTISVAGHAVNSMTAERDGAAMTVLYYWVKLANPSGPPPGSPLGRIYRLRRLVSHESLSLFVRIIVPPGLQGRADVERFAACTWDAVQPILGGKGEIVLDK